VAWHKPSAELAELLASAVARFRAEPRTMFGCPCYFANGNMFAGVHQESLLLRLSEAHRAEIQAAYDEVGPFEPMPGRPMREYVAVPESAIPDEDELRRWIGRAHDFARSLPPKPAKKAAR